MEHKIELQKREVFTDSPLTVREADERPIIEGVAIVCNKETVLYEDDDVREIEIIEPSCLKRSWEGLFINDIHDRARSFGQVGHNLTVEPRENCLSFNCWGTSGLFREVYALIDDGVRNGCSFEFGPKDFTVVKRQAADGKTEYVIRHREFAYVTAITVAMYPAYKQTSVNARELYREQHGITDAGDPDAEAAKREAELKAQADKVNRERAIAVLQSQFAAEDAEDARQ